MQIFGAEHLGILVLDSILSAQDMFVYFEVRQRWIKRELLFIVILSAGVSKHSNSACLKIVMNGWLGAL